LANLIQQASQVVAEGCEQGQGAGAELHEGGRHRDAGQLGERGSDLQADQRNGPRQAANADQRQMMLSDYSKKVLIVWRILCFDQRLQAILLPAWSYIL
jgi:hypothetical protein